MTPPPQSRYANGIREPVRSPSDRALAADAAVGSADLLGLAVGKVPSPRPAGELRAAARL